MPHVAGHHNANTPEAGDPLAPPDLSAATRESGSELPLSPSRELASGLRSNGAPLFECADANARQGCPNPAGSSGATCASAAEPPRHSEAVNFALRKRPNTPNDRLALRSARTSRSTSQDGSARAAPANSSMIAACARLVRQCASVPQKAPARRRPAASVHVSARTLMRHRRPSQIAGPIKSTRRGLIGYPSRHTVKRLPPPHGLGLSTQLLSPIGRHPRLQSLDTESRAMRRLVGLQALPPPCGLVRRSKQGGVHPSTGPLRAPPRAPPVLVPHQ